MTPDEHLQVLQTAFDIFDVDDDGFLDLEEMVSALHEMGRDVSPREAQQLMLAADPEAEHRISFHGFTRLIGGLTIDGDTQLRRYFTALDVDGDGLLSAVEVRRAAVASGLSLSLDQVREMLATVDPEGRGRIGFEAFKRLLTGGQ